MYNFKFSSSHIKMFRKVNEFNNMFFSPIYPMYYHFCMKSIWNLLINYVQSFFFQKKNPLSWYLKGSGFSQFLSTLLSRNSLFVIKPPLSNTGSGFVLFLFFSFFFWLFSQTKEMRKMMFQLSQCILIFKIT